MNISQNIFPEILKHLVIINAPFLFKGIWVAIKKWVDKKTTDKTNLFSNSGIKFLSKHIDIDKLPREFKGECDKPMSDYPGIFNQDL